MCRGDVRQGWVGRVDVEHCLKEKGGIRVSIVTEIFDVGKKQA